MTPSELARKVFINKYGLQVSPDVIPWLDSLARHFELQNDPQEMLDTFEHLVKGVLGTGSGLGQSHSTPRLDAFGYSHALSAADGPGKITVELLEDTYEKLRVAADQPVNGSDQGQGDDLESTHYLKIVNAFDMPQWHWADERKGFEK